MKDKPILTGQSRASSLISKINRPFIVGHRGSSNSYPENTVLSIERAIADGAEAIEFDINLTLDGEIIILHDSSLDRTTTGEGSVSTKNFHGYIESLTTKKPPHCKIPRFQDVLDVLLKPENSGIWAVIDVKIENSPEILKVLSTILKQYDDLSHFGNRLYLGIWHPKFLPVARHYLPDLPIVHIGCSLQVARKYFSNVDGYNMLFTLLCNNEGKKFIEDAHELSKPVLAWTINREDFAKDCYDRGVDAIMTDKPKYFINYFGSGDSDKKSTNWFSSWFVHLLYSTLKIFIDYMYIRRLKQYGDLEESHLI